MAEKKVKALSKREKDILMLSSVISLRAELMARFGKSYSDDRDIYRVMGYKKNLVYEDFVGLYARLDIAKRCIDAPVQATWMDEPVIVESEDEETEFELAWADLCDRLKLHHVFARLDKLAGLGQYAVLFVGYDDGGDYSDEVARAGDVKFIRPFGEANAQISSFINDRNDPNHGNPLLYSLQYSASDRQETTNSKVHYSRVLHVADGLLEDNVYGTPRLQAVFNTLKNIELVGYTSAEMFYRGAFPGMSFNLDKDADVTAITSTAMQDEIDDYIHQMKRYLKLQGVDVQQLIPAVVDPSGHLDCYYDQISAALGIPKRILLGSERGELASSQDERGWNNVITERRINFANTCIVRPFIDSLIEKGVLPEPKEGYTIEWPDLNVPSAVEEADVALKRTQALAQYASAPGADMIIPPDVYLRKFLGMEKYEVEEINEMVGDMLVEGERDRKDAEEKERKQVGQPPVLEPEKDDDASNL